MFKKNPTFPLECDDILDKTTHLHQEYSLNPNEWTLLFDGCSKGNPGEAGCGAVIYKNGQEVWSSSKYLGKKTNNQAEYSGLIIGLKQCIKLQLSVLKVKGDSLLIINQMNLKYMVNSNLLTPLNRVAKCLSSQIPIIQYEHIYRTENKRADELANIALMNNETDIDLETINHSNTPEKVNNSPIKSAIAKMFKKQVSP